MKKITAAIAGVIVIVAISLAMVMASGGKDTSIDQGFVAGGGGVRTSGDISVVDTISEPAVGYSAQSSVKLYAGGVWPPIMFDVYLNLQGDNRPYPQGWQVPLTVCFCPSNSGTATLLNPGSEIPCFTGITTAVIAAGGTRAMMTVGPVSPGTYDITADSSTTLMNVKRNVGLW